jgi:hypothetical protein
LNRDGPLALNQEDHDENPYCRHQWVSFLFLLFFLIFPRIFFVFPAQRESLHSTTAFSNKQNARPLTALQSQRAGGGSAMHSTEGIVLNARGTF